MPAKTDFAPATKPQGTRFLIVTDNPLYDGKVFGVPIYKGVGILDAASLDDKLGHALADILTELHQWRGYSILALGPDQTVEDALQGVRQKQALREAKINELITLLSDSNVAAQVRAALENKRA